MISELMTRNLGIRSSTRREQKSDCLLIEQRRPIALPTRDSELTKDADRTLKQATAVILVKEI